MCGIAGIIGKRDEALIRTMTATLQHRGPDGEGFHTADGVSLGHRRLVVIDREGGVQPMFSEDQRYCVVYNGEIYNFKSLRRDLKKLGHQFHTHSDTEVLLHSYMEYGTACVEMLQGMFAFAVYDAQEKKCFLARDPLGVKPLYYAEQDGSLYFASEMKALLTVPGFSREMDYEALDDYLTYLYAMPPRTLFKHIRQLPPGHSAVWQGSPLNITRYWRLECAEESRSEEEWCAELLEQFDQTVQDYLVSDVPLGAYLSAGMDSASIVASMCRQHNHDVSTFTIGFSEEGRYYDERIPARSLAQHFNTQHNELIAQTDIRALLPTVVSHFDEPFGNPTALLSYLIAQQVRKHVTVILSGDGGDEIFAGYPRYAGLVLGEWYSQLPHWLRARVLNPLIQQLPENTSGLHALRRLRSFASGSTLPPLDRYLSWVSYYTSEQKKSLYQDQALRSLGDRDAHAPMRSFADEYGGDDAVTQAMYMDLHTFLPNNVLHYGDRMSMAHGLETRVPFADPKFVAWAMKMPRPLKLKGTQGKRILRHAMSGRLPDETLRAKKQGFNPPMGVWLNTTLKPLVAAYLSLEVIEKRGYFQAEYVQQLVADHQRGKRDYTWHLWALLVFEEWHRQYLD